MPDPRPMEPRVDDTAADVATLVELELMDPPPRPSYQGLFVEPDLPPPDEPDVA